MRSEQAFGGGSADAAMDGAPYPECGYVGGRAWDAPIPCAVVPGRAEQTRHLGWRAIEVAGKALSRSNR